MPILDNAHDRMLFGQDPAAWPDEPLAQRWDPRQDFRHEDGKSDVDWIGEDVNGVWLKLDPRAALYLCPRLEAIVAGWSVGHGREFCWHTLESIASITWEGWHIMTAAQDRGHNVKAQ